MAEKQHPIRGQCYTIDQIKNLSLRDNAFLRVPNPTTLSERFGYSTVQSDEFHEDTKELWKAATFKYLRETDEWIPLFEFVGTHEDALKFLDFDLLLYPYENSLGWWVTEKGYPIPQYYTWDSEDPEKLVDSSGDKIKAPQQLIDARNRLQE